MSTTKKQFFIWLFFIAVLIVIVLLILMLQFSAKRTVVRSSEQAWVLVSTDNYSKLKKDIQEFSLKNSLLLSVKEWPGPPWKMLDLKMTTPEGNEIQLINATDQNQFTASIVVFHPRENWQEYWKKFRAFVSSKYKWTEVQ